MSRRPFVSGVVPAAPLYSEEAAEITDFMSKLEKLSDEAQRRVLAVLDAYVAGDDDLAERIMAEAGFRPRRAKRIETEAVR